VTTGVFAVKIASATRSVLNAWRFESLPRPSDDNRVDVLRPVEVVDAVRDGCRRVRALDGGVLYQDVNGRVLFVDRVLDVVPGIAT